MFSDGANAFWLMRLDLLIHSFFYGSPHGVPLIFILFPCASRPRSGRPVLGSPGAPLMSSEIAVRLNSQC